MSYEEQDVIWRVALASYDPREMRVWTRYLEERNPAIRCTGYRSSRPLLERLEQGDVDVLVLGGRLEDMDSIRVSAQDTRPCPQASGASAGRRTQ